MTKKKGLVLDERGQEIEGEVTPEDEMALIKRDLDSLVTPSGKRLAAVISQQQLTELWSPTPKYAIKSRPGSQGKMYQYVSHGYVEFKLNKAFGGDWDLEPLPAFNGNVFHLQIAEGRDERGQVIQSYSVAVMARLTVRIRDPKTLEVVSVIVKQEFGSATWYPANEFGDALKSALSDALKRCGLRLGIALDLYYNDERTQQDYSQREAAAKAMSEQVRKAKQAAANPTGNLPDMILRVNQDYGKQLAPLLVLLYGEGTTVGTGMPRLTADFKADPKALWERIKDVCMPEFNEPDGPIEQILIEGLAPETLNSTQHPQVLSDTLAEEIKRQLPE